MRIRGLFLLFAPLQPYSCFFIPLTILHMSLLVIGSVAFDALETPFGKTDKIIGGAATYISLAASYSTKPVNLVAVVGGDFPQADILTLEEHGVNTEGLQIKPDEKSFFWSGKYSKDLFDSVCGVCHEAEHRASMVPDLHNLKVPTNPDFWRTWITFGKPGTLMPAFAASQGGPLSDVQISSLAAYLNSTIPSHVPPVPE